MLNLANQLINIINNKRNLSKSNAYSAMPSIWGLRYYFFVLQTKASPKFILSQPTKSEVFTDKGAKFSIVNR